MKVELGRVVGLCLAVYMVPALSSSCASSEEDPVFNGGGRGNSDSSAGAGGSGGDVGGAGGTSPAGTGGVFPGTGGVNPGTGGANPGTGGANPGTGGTGTGGNPGTGGALGTGGSTAGTSGRMCNVAFCPNTGMGTVCCIDPPVDACGMDNGTGCVKTD